MGAKLESLKLLKSMGLNTSNFQVLETLFDVENFLKNNTWERVSIRTDPKVDGLEKVILPFFPNLREERAYEEIEKLVDKISELNIIVSEGIDPRDSLLSAKYYKDRPFNIEVVEFIQGPSTVRDIEYKIPQSITYNPWGNKTVVGEISSVLLKRIDETVEVIRQKILTRPAGKEGVTIVEFSIYKYPVGWVPDEVIFWEIIDK